MVINDYSINVKFIDLEEPVKNVIKRELTDDVNFTTNALENNFFVFD